jgi:rhamnulokinase
VPAFVAIDLGASSGRVVRVEIDPDGAGDGHISVDMIRRFETRTVSGPNGALTWDVDEMLDDVRAGLVQVTRLGPVESVAIDSWGVDYGLLDAGGERVGSVHAYRSARTRGVMDDVVGRVGRERIYAITGVQFLPFNTAYQLVAARDSPEYRDAARLLMVPDLMNHALCGSTTNDITNASTTQLLDVTVRHWSDVLVAALGLRRDVLPDLHEPGAHLGTVRGVDPTVDGMRVVAAASHDTASAVVGTPLVGGGTDIYISCGTWALVGTERSDPVNTGEALAANVTNELGAGGTVRLLKNVTGLWLLEECRRAWSAEGHAWTAAELVAAAADVPGGRSVIDPDDERFAAPGHLPARIASACATSGQPVPESPPATVRVILDSIALAWRSTVATIERVAGITAPSVHLVGGGANVALLRRLCASACERRVMAGPAEATVLGNAIVQAVAAGVVTDVQHGRALLARSVDIEEISPEPMLDWSALEERRAELAAR